MPVTIVAWIGCLKKIVLVCLLIALYCQPAWSEERIQTFGVIMMQSSLMERWRPLADDLGKALGHPVKIRVFNDYAGAVWAMGANRIQIAWLGNKTALEAVDRAGGEVVCRAVDEDGEDMYVAQLITNVASGLNGVEDVLAHAGTITFRHGDPNSTSGFVVPNHYLFFLNGIDPHTIFKRMIRGSHEENFLAVADGRADAATSNSVAMKQFKILFPEKFKTVKVIWSSSAVYSDPIVVRKGLSESVKKRTVDFFLHYGRAAEGKTAEQCEHERAVLANMLYSGFVESSNLQLTPIRLIELSQTRARLQDTAALSSEERQIRVNDVEEKIRKIESRPRKGVH
jgi:phosphonate transport system substrate-binding protein